MESHAEAIDRMGGQTSLARALGLKPALLTHWKRRGIPSKYWPRIEKTDLARECGITAAVLDNLPINRGQS